MSALFDLIISIKPTFTKQILSGNKTVEYRKAAPQRHIRYIYIYETKPTMKIIGFFPYSGFYQGTPQDIWDKTKNMAGISKEYFDMYYKDTPKAIALKIFNLTILPEPIMPKEFIKDFTPPQSFKYIKVGSIYE